VNAIGQFGETPLRGKHFGDILDPCSILANCWVRDLKTLFQRVKGDANVYGLVVLGENFAPQGRCPA
jgi:hypothetical protein